MPGEHVLGSIYFGAATKVAHSPENSASKRATDERNDLQIRLTDVRKVFGRYPALSGGNMYSGAWQLCAAMGLMARVSLRFSPFLSTPKPAQRGPGALQRVGSPLCRGAFARAHWVRCSCAYALPQMSAGRT